MNCLYCCQFWAVIVVPGGIDVAGAPRLMPPLENVVCANPALANPSTAKPIASPEMTHFVTRINATFQSGGPATVHGREALRGVSLLEDALASMRSL
jgi:hypothetical protein